jgi:drug/metabolite transporter (DMT)-like permease
MHIILLFLIIIILEFIALYSVKKYSINKNIFLLMLSCICYAAIPITMYFVLIKGNNISTVNITWNILSTLYGLLIGMIIFGEKVKSLQLYGVILGLVSLAFIFYDGDK